MPLDFQKLLDVYPGPAVDKATLFTKILGGGFSGLVADKEYDNTCAIRLSALSVFTTYGPPDAGFFTTFPPVRG